MNRAEIQSEINKRGATVFELEYQKFLVLEETKALIKMRDSIKEEDEAKAMPGLPPTVQSDEQSPKNTPDVEVLRPLAEKQEKVKTPKAN